MENLRVSQSEIRKRVETVLGWTGLTGFENRLTHTLSGGETQKLALAGALAIGNKILILDEAFSMLDNVSRNDARDLVRDLKGKLGLTIIEMTNRAREISSADMIFFLGPSGKLEFAGPPVQFLSSALGSEWTAPQSGLYGLLSALPGKEINQVENLIGQLGIRLA
jgi:energy-coupling factor transporter ATP-binding protein EcfA2